MAFLEIAETPDRWPVVRLGDVLDVVRGASPRPKGDPRYFGGDVPWVLISDVTREPSKHVRLTRETVTRAGAELSRLLPKGTLILTNSATVGVPKFLGVDACIHDGFVAFPSIPAFLAPDFLYEYFRALRPVILREIRQGVTQVNLNTDIVRDMRLPVPPVNEQHRIVAKLEALEARSCRARQALDAVPPLLEKLRQSILAAAFRGDLTKDWRAKHKDVEPASELLKRIRAERRKKWEEAELAKMKGKGKLPTDEKWKARYKEPEPVDPTGLPRLPEGWCWTSVEACSVFVTDGDHNPPKRVPTGIPHLTAKNIKNHQLQFEDCSFLSDEGFERTRQRYEPIAGDIVITCVGTLGETAIVPPNVVFSADRNLAAIRLVYGGLSAALVQYWLNTLSVQRHLGIVSGSTAQPHLYLGDLRALAVPVVPVAEQETLVTALSDALARVQDIASAATSAAMTLVQLECAIVAKAFRGQLVAQEPGDEPADAMLARLGRTIDAPGGDNSMRRAPKRIRPAKKEAEELA